jgi:homopolymeric O-antigen transport system permease protein
MSDITSVSDPLLTRHISAGTKPVVQEPGSPTDDPGASTKRAPLPLRVYTPEPLLRHPVRLVREMAVDIWSGRELAWRLFIRDLSASYRQTWFGYAWAFLPPLANALTFVFLHSQGLFETGATTVPYAAFAMIGTLLWQIFVDALNSPVTSLLQAKPMLTKINFPRESILIAGLGMVCFNFLIRLVLLGAVLLWFKVPITASILLFPVGVAALVTCGFAVGLAISPIGGLYADVSKALPMITSFWMLLTPVVYPAKETGLAGMLTAWNPVSPLIITTRQFLTGEVQQHLLPFALAFGGSLLIALCGLIAFRLTMPHVIARMGG